MPGQPGEKRVPEPGVTWAHYEAAKAPSNTTINGVVCNTRADMVINGFWVIYLVDNKKFTISLVIALISVVS